MAIDKSKKREQECLILDDAAEVHGEQSRQEIIVERAKHRLRMGLRQQALDMNGLFCYFVRLGDFVCRQLLLTKYWLFFWELISEVRKKIEIGFYVIHEIDQFQASIRFKSP